MEEVADTLRELGVEPLMTAATVKRQREMGQLGKHQSVRGVLKQNRTAMLGAIATGTKHAQRRLCSAIKSASHR
jgi:hypothetical protein